MAAARPNVIRVSADLAGLRVAALELFEGAMLEEQSAPALRRAPLGEDRDRVLERTAPARSLSPGYYERVAYLLSLEQELGLGLMTRPSELLASELDGLFAVKSARSEFEREHPACPGCGALNQKFAATCRACRRELRESSGGRR